MPSSITIQRKDCTAARPPLKRKPTAMPSVTAKTAKKKLHGTSVIEVQLRYELAEFFDVAFTKEDRVLRIDGKRVDPDILIPSMNLVIEYDGNIYHIDRQERDIRKTKALAKAGYTVIRLREEPLRKLHRNDVVVPRGSSAKFLAEVTLAKMEKVLGITVDGFDEYCNERLARGTKKANAHIDMLLESASPQARNKVRTHFKGILGRHVQWEDAYDKLLYIGCKEVDKRADALTEVFGNKTWRSNPELLSQSAPSIRKTAAVLEHHFGPAWKKRPSNLRFKTSTITARVKVINRVMGGEHWKQYNAQLIGLPSELIVARGKFLTKLFGNKVWQHNANLLLSPEETLQAKADVLDQTFGQGQWSFSPNLLSLSSENVTSKVADLDALFGDRRWTKQPTLLSCSIENLQGKVRIIETYGDDSWKDVAHLLTRASTTLERHAQIITEGFGHEVGKQMICDNIKLLGRTDAVLQAMVEKNNK